MPKGVYYGERGHLYFLATFLAFRLPKDTENQNLTTATMNGNAEENGGAVGRESINTEIVTLTRFLNEEQVKHKEATGDFT